MKSSQTNSIDNYSATYSARISLLIPSLLYTTKQPMFGVGSSSSILRGIVLLRRSREYRIPNESPITIKMVPIVNPEMVEPDRVERVGWASIGGQLMLDVHSGEAEAPEPGSGGVGGLRGTDGAGAPEPGSSRVGG